MMIIQIIIIIIEIFFHNYKNIIDISYKIFTLSKLNYIYPINKLTMFFNFCRNKIPSKIKKSFDNFFIDQNASLIDNKSSFYVFIKMKQLLKLIIHQII